MVLTETRPLSRPEEHPSVTLARLRRLLQVSVALNARGDAGLLDYIAVTTRDVLDCEAAAILLFDDRTGALRFEAATGAAGASLVGTEVPVTASLAGAIFREDRILHAADAEADARRFRRADEASGFATRAMLGVPMRIDGRPIGVMQALNPRREAFDAADAEVLLIVASQAAVAIRNARHEAALQRAHDRLSDLDRLKTNFMAIASHELRTPLTAVQGFGQILAEEVRGDLHAHADAILRAGERMMDVVESIDVMADLDAKGGSHPGSLVSLSAALADVLAQEAPHARASLPEGPLLVEGDGRRLRLAFGHVLRNAVQFSAPGADVRLAASVADGQIRVAVEDAGRGLAEADLDLIFEAYHQVQDPDRRDHEGLGVGLTIARAVVMQHGGRLWAESAGPGLGTTIHARLPLAA